MAGRDLSAELFDGAPAPKGGRDLSADLFGDAPAPATGPSRTERFTRGLRDPIDGGAQLLANLLPDGLVQGVNRANNWLADKTGLVARLPEGGVDQQVREANADYEARRAAAGQSGIDGYRLLGNVVSPANAAIATRAPAAASLAGRIGVGMAGGAASGALAPVADGEFWDEKAKQAGVGAALGGLVPAVGAGVARVVSPNASRNTNLQLLRREGVTPTIGQALGGRLGAAEEKLQSLPIVGDAIASARGRANEQFQEAAFNRALAPVGQKLPAGLSGRDAIVHTENVLRQSYDDVLNRIGAIPRDEQFATKVDDLKKLVNKDVLSKDAKRAFQMVLNDVESAFDNGILTSEGFKRVESQLGADARKLGGSQNIYEGRLAPAVRQLQEELRGLLQRHAGGAADDLRATNTAWANFKRVQTAAARVGAEGGDFSPAQFQSAVRALDKSKDKGAFARGSALGQDLGDAGRSVLTGKVADSGTAGRALLGVGALGSSYLLNPAVAAGLLGGAGAYLSPAQRALVAAVASRPQAAQGAANALRRSAPVLVPGAVQLGLQVLE